MKSIPYDPKLPAKVYELSKSGMNPTRIRHCLGVTETAWNKWKREHPEVLECFRAGKKARSAKNGIAAFHRFVYGRLPRRLKLLWKEIRQVKGADSLKRLQTMQRDLTKRQRMNLFMYAIVDCNFNASAACQKIGLSSGDYARWKKDPDFRDLMMQMHEAKKDLFEGGLIGLVKQGDVNATIFANRTANADRGYNPAKKVEHTGLIGHEHMTVEMDDIIEELPLEVQVVIREAIKKRHEQIDTDISGSRMLPAHIARAADLDENDIGVIKGPEVVVKKEAS
jgi:hypothetical protein